MDQSPPPCGSRLMNASRTLILSCLVLASPVPAAAAPAEGDLAVLADGTRFRGELDAADANWRLAFHGEGLERTASAAELIC